MDRYKFQRIVGVVEGDASKKLRGEENFMSNGFGISKDTCMRQ